MKKLIFIFSFLLVFASINCQIRPGVVALQKSTAAPVGYDADYQAVYDLLSAKPGTDTAAAQNTLVVELKAAGVWAKGALSYVTAQRTEAGALLNWLAPSGAYNLVNTTATPFVAYQGFTGASATTERLTTGRNFSTDSTNFGKNNATVSAYTRVNLNATESILGCYDGGNNMITLLPRTGGAMASRLNSTTEGIRTTANSTGLSTVTRTSTTVLEFYKNGTSLGSPVATTSTVIPNATLLILARGATSQNSNNQVSFIFIGVALTDTEVADMNTAVEKYMDFLGTGVE